MASACAALRLALPRLPISSFRSCTLPLFNPSLSSSLTSNPPPLFPSSLRLYCASSPPLIVSPLDSNRDLQNETDSEDREEDEESELTTIKPLENLPILPSPKLSVKEKKELASFAHSLGKKLKSQQVGKSGVTPSVAASFVENLESNELLKLKIHGSCPGELPDVINQLQSATGSVAVDQIGRTVILYRPSLTKMKKREAAAIRKSKAYSAIKIQTKGQNPTRVSGEKRHQIRDT